MCMSGDSFEFYFSLLNCKMTKIGTKKLILNFPMENMKEVIKAWQPRNICAVGLFPAPQF